MNDRESRICVSIRVESAVKFVLHSFEPARALPYISRKSRVTSESVDIKHGSASRRLFEFPYLGS